MVCLSQSPMDGVWSDVKPILWLLLASGLTIFLAYVAWISYVVWALGLVEVWFPQN